LTPPEQEGQMFDLYDLDKKLALNYGLLRGRDV
jgi:hypothetical protein